MYILLNYAPFVWNECFGPNEQIIAYSNTQTRSKLVRSLGLI